ncbi:hypothetical protein LCGC14_1479780 [marine sediment metagenome]|uniref:Uncharacterized protein n=1 Tax=marine sediment metagenome TaxID=412755 RepID=A0A0F9GSS6_9ZZZZ
MKRIKIKLEFKDLTNAIANYSKEGKEIQLIILNKRNFDLFIVDLDSLSKDHLLACSNPMLFGYPVFRSEDMSYNEFIIA